VDPGQQFRKLKGFDKVIIGTRVKPTRSSRAYFAVSIKMALLITSFAQPVTNTDACPAWHHPIQENNIIWGMKSIL